MDRNDPTTPRLPAGVALPVRENYPGHRCRCQLVYDEDPIRLDRCGGMATDPDDPLCIECTTCGHANLPTFRLWQESFTTMKQGGTET